jgi:hypothetical protein
VVVTPVVVIKITKAKEFHSRKMAGSVIAPLKRRSD